MIGGAGHIQRVVRRSARSRLVLLAALVLGAAGCAESTQAEPRLVVRTADQVQVVSAEEAQRLLGEGESKVGAATRNDVSPTEATLSVTEASRSFQVKLGTALTVFNSCLGEAGFSFVGIPGQTDDPLAAEPGYLGALISCNNESGIGSILAEQTTRQQSLTAEQKIAINESGRKVFECLIDRGWDMGELTPNQNGILTASRFPDIAPSRQTEFQRDLDECGWNDLELG